MAIDITSEAERCLAQRGFAALGAEAKEATHLADSALSVDAAKVTRSDARGGHGKQQKRWGGLGEEGRVEGEVVGFFGSELIFRRIGFCG